ncbi:Relaxase/Mobilisation nuclease domain-containing protein [Nonlabens sp. Hel1_33_55]|uniref:relaxase/mobilization nuclease domain-containing protein n=1 Tax=Nonlabens sp. Hel1_33_55 TaxID=1336802 RepID=UPI000875C376|nr:relaxase/mobilization nuclease domain-containing protein [Nonlabens sp. Hel1_33_55]SCY19014.1 Relaxase/Mobilisation nuclease domain-containing protein [Nonlabens sp. Hel1_33_55]
MIANITTGSQLGSLIDYHEDKIKQNKALVFAVGNTVGNNVNEAYGPVKLMIANNANHSNRKDKIFHASMSFVKSDEPKLSHESMKKIVEMYLDGLGFPENLPYIGYLHYDTDNFHLHIVSTTVDAFGKSFGLSNNFRKSQRISRKIENHFDLYKVSSIKKCVVQPELKKTIANDGTNHTYIDRIVHDLLYTQKIYSNKNLAKELLKHNIVMQEVVEKNYSLEEHKTTHKGFVFYLESQAYKRGSRAIPSSKIKSFPSNEKKRQSIYKGNRLFRNDVKNDIKFMIINALRKYESIDTTAFCHELHRQGVNANLKINKNRLVGLSFIHQSSKIKFSGEQIGKTFTASNINSQLNFGGKNELSEFGKESYKIEFITSIISHLSRSQQIKILVLCGYEIMIDKNRTFIHSQAANDKNYHAVLLKPRTTDQSNIFNFRKYNNLIHLDSSKINSMLVNRQLVEKLDFDTIGGDALIHNLSDNMKAIGHESDLTSNKVLTNIINISHLSKINSTVSSDSEVDGIDEDLDNRSNRKKKKKGRGI